MFNTVQPSDVLVVQAYGAPETGCLGEMLVTHFGMGTAAIGRLYEDVPEAEARETIALALGSGISYFDTAPLYGAGLAEKRLGAALAGTVRDSFIVSTKVGRLVRPAGADHGGQAGSALTIEPDLAAREHRGLQRSGTRGVLAGAAVGRAHTTGRAATRWRRVSRSGFRDHRRRFPAAADEARAEGASLSCQTRRS